MERTRTYPPEAKLRWPPRVMLETALAGICAALAVLSFFIPDWIEQFFDESPDNGSGEAEWGIVLAFAIAALVAGWLARRDWRRWMQAVAPGRA